MTLALLGMIFMFLLSTEILKSLFFGIIDEELRKQFGHLHSTTLHPNRQENGEVHADHIRLRRLAGSTFLEGQILASQISFTLIFGIFLPMCLLLPIIRYGKLGYQERRALYLLWTVIACFGISPGFIRILRTIRGLSFGKTVYDTVFSSNRWYHSRAADYMLYILIVVMPLLSVGLETSLPFTRDSGTIYLVWIYGTRVAGPITGIISLLFMVVPEVFKVKKVKERVGPQIEVVIARVAAEGDEVEDLPPPANGDPDGGGDEVQRILGMDSKVSMISLMTFASDVSILKALRDRESALDSH
ncbi:hypothetical protein HDU67_004707 [Dinochytrium kinnereticum]|nr:hypothetical protein HDU67_004707 [Dinochytrium kinnereticum]